MGITQTLKNHLRFAHLLLILVEYRLLFFRFLTSLKGYLFLETNFSVFLWSISLAQVVCCKEIVIHCFLVWIIWILTLTRDLLFWVKSCLFMTLISHNDNLTFFTFISILNDTFRRDLLENLFWRWFSRILLFLCLRFFTLGPLISLLLFNPL